MKKLASVSSFSIARGVSEVFECQYDWPEDCYCQCGDMGVVIQPHGDSYYTAFFEAFPRDPNTFIRGEGATMLAAEESAWRQYQQFSACPGHEFEARGYENGGGLCKHCGMFGSQVIAPFHPCANCGALTWHARDNQERFWCEACYPDMPKELWTDLRKLLEKCAAEDAEAAGELASIDDAGDDGPADSQATCFRCGLRYEDCGCETGRHSGFGSSET